MPPSNTHAVPGLHSLLRTRKPEACCLDQDVCLWEGCRQRPMQTQFKHPLWFCKAHSQAWKTFYDRHKEVEKNLFIPVSKRTNINTLFDLERRLSESIKIRVELYSNIKAAPDEPHLTFLEKVYAHLQKVKDILDTKHQSCYCL